ncbi:TKL protein kinase [Phytophthora megakarya]|uniref:TKL protein kinase n=1 Tax=Phytophthora megakarya TaxID=4795 RepID=A0A225WSJ4_9STRA|nr:TKL protein kinase [Phytophthora megakarya]
MSGWFNGQHVAVKMLLPEYRKSMKHLNSFLEEVRLTAILEHPRIVQFIGVAWDSLADLCVLTEFMKGGDLRSMLNSYEAQRLPVGFNETKVTIALHVAHALTYLHSLDPPVLHRDLKSKNILLSANHDAKLTDFGISREHVDHTMTAGVGTSRWMAPEVMMGESYDDKADVFSMGVVLSELDLHALPYSHAKDENSPSRKIPSTAIAHLVAMGKLKVEFSSASSVIAELGLSCVEVDPDDRPTAAEALYKLHTILTTEYDSYTLFVTARCNVTDRFKYTTERFQGFDYVMMEEYDGVGCEHLVQTTVYPASGVCEKSSALANSSNVVNLFSNGTAAVIFYTGTASGNTDSSSSAYSYESSQLGGRIVADDGISWSAIALIVVGAVACVATLGFATFKYLRRRSDANLSKDTGIAALAASYAGYPTPESALNAITLGSEASYSTGTTDDEEKPRSRRTNNLSCISGLWDDEIIITARVPREKVILQDLISRGGYGEVYAGMFNDESVAVKMLLPEMRKSISHLNAFLAEVKLMATLNHERIVQFVGVAWDSLTDLCVLSEFMEGGDLRTLLKNCEEHNTPLGFDRSKATIALHVAHALTYLHSLSPPVLHRDLKSKNILLTAQLDAKLTDFGVSRERSDHTMTGGVGSSRWMAPEVMMGERYDDKADMFSFGVVLAELDQHLLPYANTKDNSNSGRAMPDLAILQMVATGRLRIEFSDAAPKAIKELGMACVSIDPNDRPTASEALYKLHTILARGL